MPNGTIESAGHGYANGLALQIDRDANGNIIPLSEAQKDVIISNAAHHFGEFLRALGVDWENDPNSNRTPFRVAKAYVHDLWEGRFNPPPAITTFPADGYGGMIVESYIPVTSMCSHHHQAIQGFCHVGYIPNERGEVVGLSKLNRIVEYFCRRGAIQEQLTKGIHDAFVKILDQPQGVAVSISATHNCVACRGVKHQGASTQTAVLSGYFKLDDKARDEFYQHITQAQVLR